MTARQSSERDSGGEGGSVLTASVIAQLTGGRLEGAPDTAISSVASLDRAREGQLSFCASSKYAPLLAETAASVVLVSPDVAQSATRAAARVIVDKPHDSMLALLPRLYVMPQRLPGVHPSAVLGRGVELGADVAIGALVVVGAGAQLGDRVTLEPGVTLGAGVRVGDDAHLNSGVRVYANSQIGRRVILHGNVVVGSDGFGYVWKNNRHEKIPHVGRCIIEDDVEIGAGTTIDRGSIDDTVIGAGTKIDNLVMIAHNVRIGRLCMIAAQAGIAGSMRIEDGVIIGGQAGFHGHRTIGKGARIAAQSGVFGDVPAGETWSGYPARPHRESLRAQAALFRLTEMVKGIERLLGMRGESRGDKDATG